MRGGGGGRGGGGTTPAAQGRGGGGTRRTRSGSTRRLRRIVPAPRPPRKPAVVQKKKRKPPASAAAERKRQAAPPPEEVDQPVEVVIQVKNQKISPSQAKKHQPAGPRKTASAGKVGKRKDCVKKESLKKASTVSPEKLENIVQVNVYTKVIPSPPKTDSATQKSKSAKVQTKKEKPEKKKPEKETKKENIKLEKEVKKEKEIKLEKEVKDEKPKKETKIAKEPKKDVKIKKEPKEDKAKEDKEEKVKEVKEDKAKSTKEDNEPKELKKVLKDDKKEKAKPKIKERKELPKERKEPVKKTESKQKEESEVDTPKILKHKIKEEKISPITVQEEEEDAYTFRESPVPSPKALPPPKTKKTKDDKAKVTISPKPKKEPAPKKKIVKRAPKVVVKEEPPILVKRHREASLNALAKVHCLYENESRNVMNEILDKSMIVRRKVDDVKVEKKTESDESEKEPEKPTRNLRSAPGMRGMGRYWDTTNIPSSSSSSSSSSAEDEESEKQEEAEVEEKEKPEKKTRKRRKRCELKMDLKDMVVTKRMASLNASAIMAASCQVEKRSGKGSKSDDSSMSSSSMNLSSDEEVVVSGASKKVAVIVNQDTDLTITGLYTTRSTRHEGYCSIAGMQYRISSTSHTQTEATAVSSETLIHTTDHVSLSHSESGGSVDAGGTSSPGGSLKSYTPLGALSSMQPPGQQQVGGGVGGGGGRQVGPSAFSAPPYHPHPQEIHGYYQPAGPLIQHAVAGKSATPDPPPPPPGYPPYPYPSPYPPPDYSPYYSRGGYRRPWAPPPVPPAPPGPPQMMTDYLEPPPPYPSYYHPYGAPPAPPPPPPPPPACYASPVRVPFIDQGFQCPCPMQSACPKNVHTGPLTGASKRSEVEAQTDSSNPLVPVALALPMEPAVSPGPPSPARGSVGMPPSSSPALSTARKERWSPPAADIKPHPPELTLVQSPPLPLLSPRPDDITPSPSPPLITCAATVVAVPPPAPPAPTAAKAVIAKGRAKRTSTEQAELGRKRKKPTKASAKAKGAKADAFDEKEDEKALINNNNNLIGKVTDVLSIRPSLKLSNGWSWEGEPFTAKVFRTTEDAGVLRRCYPAMRHDEGDIIRPRDCILLRSGPKKNLPFVAKVSAMWENPDDGEMMVSVLWYYRPEHTEAGRQDDQLPDEIFASKHKDTNSVACIEDKCYVLTFHEYARYRKSLVAGGNTRSRTVVPPPPDGYPRSPLLPPGRVASDLVFFCRQIYDFRQKKILKKPPPSQVPVRAT